MNILNFEETHVNTDLVTRIIIIKLSETNITKLLVNRCVFRYKHNLKETFIRQNERHQVPYQFSTCITKYGNIVKILV